MPIASWSTLSALERSNEAGYGLEGHIKSIGINDEENVVLIRFQPKDRPKETQTYKICLHESGNNVREFQKSEKHVMMREAFAHERTVRISFEGAFNPCLSRIIPVSDNAQL